VDSLSSVISSAHQEHFEKPLVYLLIDGDIVAYRAAAVTDGRMYTIKGGNPEQVWKYKAEAVEYCEDRGIDKSIIDLTFFPDPPDHATKIVKQIMSGIKTNLASRFPNVKLVTYLTERGNYRNSIGAGYKSGRKGLRRPENLVPCKQYLKDYYGATSEYGMEADDLMALDATRLGEDKCVVCSVDKDLKQIAGHHYNFVNDELETITFAEGRRLLWIQVISGDSTDSIFSPRGLGKKAGEKLFLNVDFDTADDNDLFEMATLSYCTKLSKTNTDLTDVRCWVEEVYNQVFLLRTEEQKVYALSLMEED